MVTVFPDRYAYVLVSFLINISSYMYCSGSAFSDCNEGSGSSTLLVFENILVF